MPKYEDKQWGRKNVHDLVQPFTSTEKKLQMAPIFNRDGLLRKPLVTLAGSTVANELSLEMNFQEQFYYN